jgi:hypothetical protein
MTPYYLGLRGIRDPCRGRYNQISIVDKLKYKHQFLGARTDEYIFWVTVDIQGVSMVFADSLAKLLKPLDSQIIFFMRVQLQFIYNRWRDRKRGLPKTQFENFPAICQQFV